MIGSNRALALWGITSLGGLLAFGALPEPSVAAQSPSSDEPLDISPGARADSVVGPAYVPFVGQTPLLCGGAAAAMLLRFFGERQVDGEDFAHLVRREAGGIATTDLGEALRHRGHRVREIRGNPEAAFGAVADGVPIMLLLEGSPTLHYVVLVRASPGHVWIHDPNFGPDRRMARSRLMDLWAESDFWALVATPSSLDGSERGTGAVAPQAAVGPWTADDPETAEDPEAAVEALSFLRQGDHERARSAARTLLAAGADDARLGRRILATSYHLEGRTREALVEWNHLGEPHLDLLDVRGADHTRHHVLVRRSAMAGGDVVTPAGLRLTARRLTSIPSVRTARVEYVPRPDGSTEVRGFVDERGRWPGLRDLAAAGFGAAADSRGSMEAGPFLALGDRWRLEGSWREAQATSSISGSFASERFPGVTTVAMDWRRERYPDPGSLDGTVATSERRRRSLGLAEWVAPSLRVEATLALESWPAGGEEDRQYAAGLGTTWLTWDDGLRVEVQAEHWRGDLRPFTRLEVGLLGQRRLGPSLALRFHAGAMAASTAAPRLLWPGAGVGEVRRPLLRGHPLADGGVIGGAVFGRRLLHATTEVRLQRRFGPVVYGASIFTDVAQAWRTEAPATSQPSPSTGPFADPGVGLFLDAGERELRLDVARGDGAWVISAGVRGPR